MAEQNFKNHGRIVPMFHIGVFLPLLVNVSWAIYRFIQAPSVDTSMPVVVGVVLLLMAFSLRVQVLTVQDRVIRLEMQLRLRTLLAPDLATQASSLSVKQMVALRFASDEELPELVGEVLAGALPTPRDIKVRIARWQADHLRA